MEGVLVKIARAQQEGAALRLGGSRARVESGGFYLDPTVFDAVATGPAWPARKCLARSWR
jgi:gamma-glutamyl-gamma-aminobutyraldehyde dehydrogenase